MTSKRWDLSKKMTRLPLFSNITGLFFDTQEATRRNHSAGIRAAGRRWERGSALAAAPGGAGRAGGTLQAAYAPSAAGGRAPSATRRGRVRRAPSAAGPPQATYMLCFC